LVGKYRDEADRPHGRRRRHVSARSAKPTAGDIAAAAGVSTATVSRVLNNPMSVSPELRERVERAVGELGYVRSGVARALASSRSFTIGAVVPTLNNAIFAASLAAFEEQLAADGYTLLVTVSNYNPTHETGQLRRLLERGVDAIMLIGLDHPEESWQLIEHSQATVVVLWALPGVRKVPCIGFDNAGAAEAVVDHLAALGHRRIAMMAGITAGNDRARARRAGVERGLRKHGLPVIPGLFIEKRYSHADGRAGFAELFDRPDPPTAIVCGNDVLAMGAIFEAQSRGIAVPGDVSIVGYDNLSITQHMMPALTTVSVPSEAMGRAAARAIVEHLTDNAEIGSITFHAPLVVRNTTGPAPAGRP